MSQAVSRGLLAVALILGGAGVLAATFSVLAFHRTYGYIPAGALALVSVGPGLIGLIGVLHAWYRKPDDSPESRAGLVFGCVIAGVALGLFGFGGWKMGPLALVFFPAAHGVAAVVAMGSPRQQGLSPDLMMYVGLGSALLLFPAFFVLLRLYTAILYLPEILIWSIIGFTLGALHSVSMLCLALKVRWKTT